MLFRALSILLALPLGGCAMSGLLPDWSSDDIAGPEPTDYRFVLANRIKTIIGDLSDTASLEISRPERTDSLKGASWVVCIKAPNFPLLPRFYAAFIQRGQMVDSRLSVLIDRCELQTYAPFDWKADANNPPR